MTQPQLSIVILNYKTRRSLRRLLRALYAHPFFEDQEIIVVDNGSGDGSTEMVRDEFPQVILHDTAKNLGYAKGINVAVGLTKAEYLLFLNTDLVIESSALSYLVEFLKDNVTVGVVGPKLLNADGSWQHSAFGEYGWLTPLYHRTMFGKLPWGRRTLRAFLREDLRTATEPQPTSWLMSSCIAVRRKALEQIDGFDELFFVYLSDTDLCRRLWEKGWQVIYDPRLTVVHYHRRESAESWRVFWVHLKDMTRYLWKWRGKPVADVSGVPGRDAESQVPSRRK